MGRERSTLSIQIASSGKKRCTDGTPASFLPPWLPRRQPRFHLVWKTRNEPPGRFMVMFSTGETGQGSGGSPGSVRQRLVGESHVGVAGASHSPRAAAIGVMPHLHFLDGARSDHVRVSAGQLGNLGGLAALPRLRARTLERNRFSGSLRSHGSFSSRIASHSTRTDRTSGVSPGARVRACGRGSRAGSVASRVDQACPDLGGGHSSTESLICAPRTVA